MWDWNGKRPSSFLEVFLPNFSGEKLKIPPRFIKHMEGKTSGLVLLMGPSGNIWHANLVKHSDDLFLHDGWPTFVNDHSIQCGDSLVFSYEGNLCFTVQIFDQSSCEKEQAFCVTCSQKPSDCNGFERKREREGEKLYADPATDCSPKKMRNISSVMLNCPEDWKMKMTVHTVEGCHLEEQDDGGKDIKASSPSLEQRLTDASEKSIVLAMPASDMRDKYICHKIKKAEMTAKKSKIMEAETTEKKKKATKNEFRVSACIEERVTRHFTSSFPYFVKVMNWSHIIKGNLNIPAKFSNKYLPKCRTKIVLHNEKGYCWTVNCIPVSRNKRRYTLSRGWTAFVRDNGIKMEDICIFELVGDCELSVRIVRLGVEGLDNQIGQGAAGDEIKGYQHQRSYENVTVEDLYEGPRPMEEGTIMIEACQDTSYSIDVEELDNKKDQGTAGYDIKEYQRQSSYEIVTMEDLYDGPGTREEGIIMTEASQNTSNNIDTKANSSTPVDPTLSLESEFADIKNDEHVTSTSVVAIPDQTERRRQVGRARRSLAAHLVDEGTEAAHLFTSPYPNFMKVMTSSNTNSKYVMRLPRDFARAHFPMNKTELVLRNPTGDCWTVKLLHDRSCSGHVLSGGWLSFVRANNIQARDICVFELVDQREFRVHIFRTTQRGVNSQSNDTGADGSVIDADSTRLFCPISEVSRVDGCM